jgi:hypothetical protein
MFEQWSPSRYETLLYNNCGSVDQRALLSGTARSLRISHADRTAGESEVISTATGVVAPLTYLYTWWLLHTAVRRGIRRIYFMARDGQIFMKVAQVLVKNWNLNIEVRYIYCSRESLLLPSFESMGSFELNWVTWGYLSSITVSEISRRLGLSTEELLPFLVSVELDKYRNQPDLPVAKEDMDALHNMLGAALLTETIVERTRPLFDLTLAYLAQEGLFDGVPYALADTGWRGSSQYAVSALMRKGKVRPNDGIAGFYVGLNCDAHRFDNDTLEAFLFDWRSGSRDYTLYNFICFEMLFAADHARTRSYHEEQGSIVAVLAEAPADDYLERVRIHHGAAVEFADRVSSGVSFDSYDESGSETALRLSRRFICTPSRMEAAVYGDWPIASEMCEGDYQRMAPPMGGMQFIRCALGFERVKGYWPQASLVRTSRTLLCLAYNLFLKSGALDWYRRFLLRY